MKNYLLYTILSLCIYSCSDNDETILPEPAPEPAPELKEGINTDLESPDADKALTVTYKAPSSSPLYGYTGDVYAHTGIMIETTWEYVPAEWDKNIDKCKMKKVEDNIWSIALSPSVRQWYHSGESSVTKLGFVFRSADGQKQTSDLFITLTDNKYQEFVPAAIKKEALPDQVTEGINLVDNSTVTLVLYDKDTDGNHKDFAHVVGDFNNWKLSNEENCQMYRDEPAAAGGSLSKIWMQPKNMLSNIM